MSIIEGYIEQISTEHVEATQEAIRNFGERITMSVKQIREALDEIGRAIQRQQIIEEDLPPIVERHLGDVKDWLREAGHDV